MDLEVGDSNGNSNNRSLLASQSSTVESYVYFFNKTKRNINIYWINFHGEQEFYYRLLPDNGVKANTYVKHPWVFRDSKTGQLMHVENSAVYWPENYRVYYTNHNRWLPCRKLISIHFPLNSLKSTCLWTYAESIFELKNNEILNNLNIPHTLLKEIEYILYVMDKHNSVS